MKLFLKHILLPAIALASLLEFSARAFKAQEAARAFNVQEAAPVPAPEKGKAATEDPECPSRTHVLRCAAQFLDVNRNGALERAELEAATGGVSWGWRSELVNVILDGFWEGYVIAALFRECDADGDESIKIDMKATEKPCLSTCSKRKAFKRRFLPGCSDFLGGTGAVTSYQPGREKVLATCNAVTEETFLDSTSSIETAAFDELPTSVESAKLSRKSRASVSANTTGVEAAPLDMAVETAQSNVTKMRKPMSQNIKKTTTSEADANAANETKVVDAVEAAGGEEPSTDSGKDCAAGGSCAPEKGKAATEDPDCPSRPHIVWCSAKYLDTNNNGALERSELEAGFLSRYLGSRLFSDRFVHGFWRMNNYLSKVVDSYMEKCDADGDEKIDLKIDMKATEETCLATCFKRSEFKFRFFPGCSDFLGGTGALTSYQPGREKVPATCSCNEIMAKTHEEKDAAVNAAALLRGQVDELKEQLKLKEEEKASFDQLLVEEREAHEIKARYLAKRVLVANEEKAAVVAEKDAAVEAAALLSGQVDELKNQLIESLVVADEEKAAVEAEKDAVVKAAALLSGQVGELTEQLKLKGEETASLEQLLAEEREALERTDKTLVVANEEKAVVVRRRVDEEEGDTQ